MIKSIFNFRNLILCLGASALLASCKKDPAVPNFANEEYDRLEVLLIPMDSLGQQSTDTTRVNYDMEGNATPSSSNILANRTYRMLINTYAHNTLINSEIIQDSTAHKFFFFANPSSAVSNYQYNDGIGLDGKISFSAVPQFTVQVLLRHGLDKTHPDAQAYNSANYQNAGGSNDINIVLNLNTQ